MNKKPVLYKSLVVVIVILFIGIGIQPAFAVNVSTTISDSEEECDICPSIEDVVDSKDLEKYQELFNKINSLKEEDKKLNSDGPICELLFTIWNSWPIFLYPWGEFMERFWENGYELIWLIGMSPIIISALFTFPFAFLYWGFCDEKP